MLSKFKRPVFILLIVLICVQIFQILYKEHVQEMEQDYERGNQSDLGYDDTQVAVKSKLGGVVKFILEETLSNGKKIMDTESSSTSTSTTTSTTTTTTTTTEAPKNDKLPASSPSRKGLVTNEVQAKIAKAIRLWGNAPAREMPSKYDGRNLLKDPVFKFNPNFKNPCWFENNKLRCLPYVFVIGVKKCGTSDLFYRMALHPDFVKPGFKEAQWFARKRFRSRGDYDDIYEYVSMFRTAAATILRQSNTSFNGQNYNYKHITGEGSPSNLHLNTHWKYLPGNENLEEPKYVILDYIHYFIPQAKIIITFRDPVDRLYSDYYHEYGTLMRSNKPNPRQFHKVVSAGVKLYQDCFKRRSVRSCVYEPSLYGQTRIQIQLGIYYIFWEDLTRLYPRDQILVLQNKNLRDKETTMKVVYQFLNLRTLSKDEMTHVVNAEDQYQRSKRNSKKGPMLNETFDLLHEFYRPFNRKMAHLLHDETFLYTGE